MAILKKRGAKISLLKTMSTMYKEVRLCSMCKICLFNYLIHSIFLKIMSFKK